MARASCLTASLLLSAAKVGASVLASGQADLGLAVSDVASHSGKLLVQ
ncbi:MAG: hypothetical protein HYS38_04175 [Acidobacteria bacterium]|nr:hypothetical protein [Acidobacteriota bacterium]